MPNTMQRLNTVQEFNDASKKYSALVDLRTEGASNDGRIEFLVCGDTGCRSIKSLEVLEALNKAIEEFDLGFRVKAQITGCFGFCKKGPIVKVYPEDIFYVEVSPEDARDIVKAHCIEHETVKHLERLLYKNPDDPDNPIKKQDEIDFYKKQKKIALSNCGLIHPDIIEEYIAVGGYLGFVKCISEYKNQEVLDIMKESGLRGRGGGGFPTGVKWQACANENSAQKYVVCNADEGDPGAFMDRSILEGDPHCIIEGMAIAAYAIGADTGIAYVRAEYPMAVKRLQQAIDKAKEVGLLGQNILGTGFNFEMEIRLGAGAFVCGEETALLNSTEGKRGEPNPKPPYPAEKGLYGCPTIINNVETFANVRHIITNGAAWFADIGTATSKGTKVFALAGKVNNVGLVEVPMGTTLREIIFEIGGGIKDGHKFKAVQTGGPSGGCISEENLDIKIDYESLSKIDSMMGSGGMIVMDEHNCMVDIAKYYLDFTMEESCGKCTPCRVGNKRLHELLEDISNGKGTMEHIEKLETLGKVIKDTALCGLGQTAPNPILSTLHFFRDEYLAHIIDKKCPAKVCVELLEFTVTEKCVGCEHCKRDCPVSCISGELREMHHIDNEKCIKCGVCISCCPVNAIIRG